jgi:hypothetical protein
MKLVTIVLSVAIGATAIAQEGAAVVPDAYKVRFENDWVKVTAVRYEPKQQLPPHAHTPNASAYVYLNDGPPVTFTHVGGKPATRAATKAGAFRVYRGLEEIHSVQNTGDAPSEFLRVELKTSPLELGTFFGKFERPATTTSEPVIHFNHAQVRVSRVWLQPGQETAIAAGSEPALVVALGALDGLKPGDTRWIDASATARMKNSGKTAVDLLRFDLRSRPRSTR